MGVAATRRHLTPGGRNPTRRRKTMPFGQAKGEEPPLALRRAGGPSGFVVTAHWVEHLAQAIQIWGLGWARPEAGGVLGLFLPVTHRGGVAPRVGPGGGSPCASRSGTIWNTSCCWCGLRPAPTCWGGQCPWSSTSCTTCIDPSQLPSGPRKPRELAVFWGQKMRGETGSRSAGDAAGHDRDPHRPMGGDAGAGPLTSDEARAGRAGRGLSAGMVQGPATAGYLAYDPVGETYELTDEVAFVFGGVVRWWAWPRPAWPS